MSGDGSCNFRTAMDTGWHGTPTVSDRQFCARLVPSPDTVESPQIAPLAAGICCSCSSLVMATAAAKSVRARIFLPAASRWRFRLSLLLVENFGAAAARIHPRDVCVEHRRLGDVFRAMLKRAQPSQTLCRSASPSKRCEKRVVLLTNWWKDEPRWPERVPRHLRKPSEERSRLRRPYSICCGIVEDASPAGGAGAAQE